eukprot:Mycagemm_TRINITY_DN3102_c0_g1::TRINITY_DN3102_c0_g1_i2::g.5427::m.5427 type:complete len:138 gc:universal TRINITY_DN3102_c0_g1_i2:572-159(-)
MLRAHFSLQRCAKSTKSTSWMMMKRAAPIMEIQPHAVKNGVGMTKPMTMRATRARTFTIHHSFWNEKRMSVLSRTPIITTLIIMWNSAKPNSMRKTTSSPMQLTFEQRSRTGTQLSSCGAQVPPTNARKAVKAKMST